jgi:hypothetical protein
MIWGMSFLHETIRTQVFAYAANIREIALLFDVPIFPNNLHHVMVCRDDFMRKWLITLMSILCLAGIEAAAQADRHYVQAGVSYVAAAGDMVDSARFNASLAYCAGYQWSPSRSTSFGLSGWFLPADVVDQDPASVFGMTAIATYRLIKHGLTPYASAEAGFAFLTLPDSLVGRKHLEPQLGFSIAATAGFLIPVSEKVEIDAAARYAHSAIGGGLSQLNGVIGLRYRLR